MSLKSSINKKFFEDRPGDVIRNPLVYSVDDGRYVPEVDLERFLDTGGNIRTAATQRIGTLKISSKSEENKSLENVGYPNAGTNLGTVTVFLGGVPEQSLQDMVDFYRSGKNIRDVEHFGRATTTHPLLRVSPSSFFEDEEDGTIDHSLNLDSYGQGFLFTAIEEKVDNPKLIPFEDFGKIIPKELMGRTNSTAYPFVHTVRKNLDQFVDPSSPQINGAIDVFEERRSTTNSSISDTKINGVKASLQGGDIEILGRGSTLIDDKIDLTNNKNTQNTFLDSQETMFIKHDFVQKVSNGTVNTTWVPGTIGLAKFSLPGFVTLEKKQIRHFTDEHPAIKSINYVDGKLLNDYKILDTQQKLTLLVSSSLSRSDIGQRFKSATRGVIFGESNSFGTDSISFGGLKK